MSGIQIREAIESDFNGIMKLMRQLQPKDPVLEDGRDLKVFQSILAAPNLHLFALLVDSEICASTYLNILPNITRSASPYAVIENVVTEEDARGQGFGKMIMQHTLEFAWVAGCYKAMLMTGSKDESTHAFYRACGFLNDAKTAYLARPC